MCDALLKAFQGPFYDQPERKELQEGKPLQFFF
jgi:hypothetical protein